jgi:transcription elongation factor GreB
MNKAFVKEDEGGLDGWDEIDEVQDDAEQELDAQMGRLRYLSKRIETAEPVDPAQQKHLNQVFFGATVTYADLHDDGSESEHTIRIVGIDEADTEAGFVSWISPIAKALMKAEEGDAVTVRTPQGPKEIEVVEIRYETD